MNIEKILDIRFIAPVGIVIFFAFIFSPVNFLILIISLSKTSWLVGVVGVLGLGFMISSITEYIIRTRRLYLSKHGYGFETIFNLSKPEDENVASELATWIVLDAEGKHNETGIPSQIHKRWHFAMANFNAAIGVALGFIFALVLNFNGCLAQNSSCWYMFYVSICLFFVCIFYSNGNNARLSVLAMDDLLAHRNKDNLEPHKPHKLRSE